ncbi:hypothetical protein KILIM_055_00200 [Kineosphaera limosa NBRC 100340]|uniref:DUF2344 domain-containing protein n=1 Tax=Kineosphaera limosa NBRC 100340 TaxID=1184609 RepID=K6WY69_9MICO|nr:hypothetical protein KILIM_055_00200 [Kineosphaera limosa NBRC 100340]
MQKLRLRYAKRGRLRFSSTRDFQRALERALRRAGVPMAFSAGFHPHPKISYANAAPTGTASEAEYAEISVVERVDPEAVRAALDAALPDGLDVLEVVEATPGSLAERLQGSRWRMEFAGLDEATLQRAVDTFLGHDLIEVTRVVKSGPRTFDVRGAVLAMDIGPAGSAEGQVAGGSAQDAQGETRAQGPECAILHVVVRHTTPVVRPDDVLTALRTHAAFEPPRSPLVTRLAQGWLLPHAAQIADPFVDDPVSPASSQ